MFTIFIKKVYYVFQCDFNTTGLITTLTNLEDAVRAASSAIQLKCKYQTLKQHSINFEWSMLFKKRSSPKYVHPGMWCRILFSVEKTDSLYIHSFHPKDEKNSVCIIFPDYQGISEKVRYHLPLYI